MWPWGHAAVGYLLYSGYLRARAAGPPSGPAALAVLLGTQFPDLVDKPLAWTATVLPTGRSLAHSWLVAAVVLGLAWWLLDERRRTLLGPLAAGWFSHGLADAIGTVLGGDLAYLGFLLWPATTTPPYETDHSFLAHLLGIELTPYFLLQFFLAGLAAVVWHRDGRPGPDSVRSFLGLEPAHESG
jgi:hypothetical protein